MKGEVASDCLKLYMDENNDVYECQRRARQISRRDLLAIPSRVNMKLEDPLYTET